MIGAAGLMQAQKANEKPAGTLYRSFDGMCWPVPGERVEGLSWAARYAGLTKQDLLCVASVLDAYQELIRMPAKQREGIIKELRKGPATSAQPESKKE